MRRFEPVHLSPGRELRQRASQTLLAKFNACRRSAYLYQEHAGGAASHEMLRGSALHEILESAIQATVNAGEVTIPPEVVKAIADEVLQRRHVPIEEQDYVREMAYRFGAEMTFDEPVIACETLIVLEVGGWQVRMKIDYATLATGGRVCRVKDWKSSRALPAYEDLSRKRADGTYAAKGFQLVLYALGLAFGRPVRIEPCGCDGGWIDFNMNKPCPTCSGHGYVEIVEPFPLAGQAQEFEIELVFPGIEDREGKMARRTVTLTRLELEEYRSSIAGLLKQLGEAEESGDWPAVPGSHCVECPAKMLCPIPPELRDFAGSINTMEEAAQASEVLDRRKALDAALQKELRAFAKAHGGEIRFGADKAWRFVYSESERIADKDGMFAAVERAARYGEPFERAQWVKPSSSTTFKVVTLTAAELTETEGSDG